MHTRPNIRLSVVIPCYDEENYIGAALESLETQDFKGRFEVIVVDNNCKDNTVAIAEMYKARIITENRAGICWARQSGTEAARGEIVISTDADTTFNEHWLSSIDEQFRSNSELVGVCAACEFVDAPWWGKIYPKILFGAVYAAYRVTGRPFYITATNTAFKKIAWDSYDTEQTQGGDELSLLHQLRRKGKVAFTNKYVVYTSSRRLNHGLWYNVFVSFLYYYLIAYYVNRLFGRPIIGSAPAYRPKTTSAAAVARFGREFTRQRKNVEKINSDAKTLAKKTINTMTSKLK